MRETWLSYQGLHLVIWQYSIHVWNKVQEFILGKKRKKKKQHTKKVCLMILSYWPSAITCNLFKDKSTILKTNLKPKRWIMGMEDKERKTSL